ncbi:MAG: insulinase family protein [Acidobacteria bacterium]|jgi:predicted Zn-dependent peptidase|nr:insulinase family protein [Acidobacteriota bacterium]
MVKTETLPSGLRLVTESLPHVRSAAIGVWLTRGSRHESDEESGIAHFVEHMLFKGTHRRTARDLAQAIDSVGGQMDAFTAKEYAGYYIKVLDEHLPIALDLLSDMLLYPALAADDVEREQGVVLEEIKMVEDAPDDLVHEEFVQKFWSRHALGRPILGTADTVSSFSSDRLRNYFQRTYVAPNLVVAAAGHLEHDRFRDAVAEAFAPLSATGRVSADAPPAVSPGVVERVKDIEQSHICLGTTAYPQGHDDRHAVFVLNTILGGSMSSRLFQHIREDRGLAYSVFSNLSTYTDAGMISIYAGCAADKVDDVVTLSLRELADLRDRDVPEEELRRAKDHLKGSVMLGLENTSSRMSHLARQEMVFGRHITLDEMLAQIEGVTAVAVKRVARDLFRDGGMVASVVGPKRSKSLAPDQLWLGGGEASA